MALDVNSSNVDWLDEQVFPYWNQAVKYESVWEVVEWLIQSDAILANVVLIEIVEFKVVFRKMRAAVKEALACPPPQGPQEPGNGKTGGTNNRHKRKKSFAAGHDAANEAAAVVGDTARSANRRGVAPSTPRAKQGKAPSSRPPPPVAARGRGLGRRGMTPGGGWSGKRA